MKFNYDIFKRRLKEVTNGIAQKDIASEIGVTESTLSKWYNGKSVPDIETLLTISEKYGCSVDYLLGNDSEKNNLENEEIKASDICRFIYVAQKAIKFDIEIQHKTDESFPYTKYVKAIFSKPVEIDTYQYENEFEQKQDALAKTIISFIDKYRKIISVSDDLGEEMENDVINMLISNSDKYYVKYLKESSFESLPF